MNLTVDRDRRCERAAIVVGERLDHPERVVHVRRRSGLREDRPAIPFRDLDRRAAWRADAADVAGFDEVVLASGILPRRPPIPGVDHRSVVGYVDLLSGRAQAGKRVVIIGAGGIGFDVAVWLLEKDSRSPLDRHAFAKHWGIDEAIAHEGGLDPAGLPPAAPAHAITMLKRSATPFGATLGRTTGWVHRAELQRNGVKMLKGVEYRKIDDAGVHIAVDGSESVLPADTVVLCAGQEPLVPFEAGGPNLHRIGGAREAGELDAKRAIKQATELAAALASLAALSTALAGIWILQKRGRKGVLRAVGEHNLNPHIIGWFPKGGKAWRRRGNILRSSTMSYYRLGANIGLCSRNAQLGRGPQP